MSLQILSPGARTLVQDFGRGGYAHLGVPGSGAADQYSLALANRLVGNADGTAALEITLNGPTLTFTEDATVALTGSPADLFLDSVEQPVGHTLHIRAGQTLSVGVLRSGLRAYLAVAGGIDVAQVLGSRSTCTLSGLGPAPLSAGQTLPIGAASNQRYAAVTKATGHCGNPNRLTQTLRILPGPHTHLFAPTPEQALALLTGTRRTVSPASSRVGTRLDGPTLTAPEGTLASLPMVTGAIQVPPGGQPIILGPDHGTTGGYPVIATVIAADLPVLAQALPGTALTFVPVTLAQARQAAADAKVMLDRAVIDLAAIHTGASA